MSLAVSGAILYFLLKDVVSSVAMRVNRQATGLAVDLGTPKLLSEDQRARYISVQVANSVTLEYVDVRIATYSVVALGQEAAVRIATSW